MLRALDRIAPAKLAIPLGIVTAAALVGLGLNTPVVALGAGIALLAGALLLSLSARWRLAGDPDPVTAGVHFEAPDQPGARWVGFACVVLGGAVLGYGAWDTVQARLTPAWDPMRSALALTAAAVDADAPPSQAPVTPDLPLWEPESTPPRTPGQQPAWAVPETDALNSLGARERPAARTGPDAARPEQIEPPEGDASVTYNGLVEQARQRIAYGQNAQAIRLLNTAAKARPDEVLPDQLLCTAYQKTGDTAQALNACKAWLSKSPNDRARAQVKAITERLRGD